jgi:hypothetical protein
MEAWQLGKTVVLVQEMPHGVEVYAPTTRSFQMADVFASLDKLASE